VTRIPLQLLLIVILAHGLAHAQSPTGTITGFVTDLRGVHVAGARITVTDLNTGSVRNVKTSTDGDYSVPALAAGAYTVAAEVEGFRRVESKTIVEAGTTTTVNLLVGELTEQVTVNDLAPRINYESHQVDGLVSRQQIESLPLNGRNFLDLARLEPGITNPIRGTNNRVFVPVLGAGVQTTPRIGFTRVTVDGGDIDLVGTIGAAMQVSQEAVQEFQIAMVNFDPATSVTTDGAINIVTRSGGNDFHGSGFYFLRDHKLSAYPGLSRDLSNPDPFFQRQQFGFEVGGPIKKGRAFFFTNYERNDQRGVVSVQPRSPDFAPLGGIFPSPYLGNQFNLRLDAHLNSNHNAFVRYTHDGNTAFGGSVNSLPSGWSRTNNWVDQTMVGLTSVLSAKLVNDLRFSYFFLSSPELPATEKDCPGCLGVGAPRIGIQTTGVAFGPARKLSLVGRRYQLTDSLVWVRENHRLRFGVDWEYTRYFVSGISADPAAITLWSPNDVRSFNATALPTQQIPLPPSFLTLNDILQLPLASFSTAVGPDQTPERDFRQHHIMDLYRLYVADTWQINPRLTVNYGLAWSYEPHSLNVDLSKPSLLIPILGPDNLHPPRAQKTNFSPIFGFAWTITGDGKTVIRGGAGLYYDPVSLNSVDIGNERQALSPLGTGRRTTPGRAIFYPPLNSFLAFTSIPTRFTGANLLAILPGIRADLLSQLNPNNRDFSVLNIDRDKAASNLSDPFYQTPYALHFSLGVQRELARDLVLTADFAWRRFLHTFINGIDYNRFNSPHPVIPKCKPAQASNLTAACSLDAITFDSTTGIAQYKGLLVRLEKRFSNGTQFLVSYALGSDKGSNGAAASGAETGAGAGFNNFNWFENYGPLPTDIRHILNFSGLVDLPRRFQASWSISAYSAPPFSAYFTKVDFNGDGTLSDLLPGTTVNAFNRGLGKADLVRLVQNYNQQFAGRLTFGGQTAPLVTLPANYSFNDNFFTEDLRLSRTFNLRREHLHLMVFGEVFNLFNTANLVGYLGNLTDPSSFGQPAARFSQVFGSGGPRALQFGARLWF